MSKRQSFLAPALPILIEGPLLLISKGTKGLNPNLVYYRRWHAAGRTKDENKSYERYFTLDDNGLKYYNIRARNTIVGSGRRMSSMMTKKLGGTISLDNKTLGVSVSGRIGEFIIEREGAADVILRAYDDVTARKWILALQKVSGIDPETGMFVGLDSSSDEETEENDDFDEDAVRFDDSDDDAEARALFRQNSDSQGWSRGSTVMTVPGLNGLVSSTNSRMSMGAGQKAARPSVLGAMVSDFGDDEAANAEIDVDDVEAHSEIKGYNELMENRQQQEEEDAAYESLMALALEQPDTNGDPESVEALLAEWLERYGSYAEALVQVPLAAAANEE